MPENNMDLCETLTVGSQSREWLISSHACSPLALYGIPLAGISHAGPGFSFLRHNPPMTQILVCFGGSGEVLVDGEWVACETGDAYYTPPHVLHGYHSGASVDGAASDHNRRAAGDHSGASVDGAVFDHNRRVAGDHSGASVDGAVFDHNRRVAGDRANLGLGRWKICWVQYFEDETHIPSPATRKPALLRVDWRPLSAALDCLHRELMGAAEHAMMQHWAFLVHAHVQRAIGPETRLRQLWERVSADLGHPWSVEELAEIVSMSPEHLRRVCHAEAARSPMRHVADLRMRAAATLLASESYSVSEVAERVGYDNAFAFSTAFKRHTGVPPSQFRGRAGHG